MLSSSTYLALTTLLSTASALTYLGQPGPYPSNSPLITIHNTAKSPICYKVEFSSGAFPLPTTCDSSPGFIVNPSETIALHPGAGFNGGITAITNGVKGARHEINFSTPGSTWYDVDYELGMSDSTLGPADHRPYIIGGAKNVFSVSGEQDTLSKANAGWGAATNKAQLLKHSKYIKQGDGGRLTYVHMDGEAPEEVRAFFQLTAEFTAYMGPGSVAGKEVKKGR